MEFEKLVELAQGHLLQGLIAVFVLPFLNWLVGRSKRDQENREEQELLHHMELSRGLHDLALKETDAAARTELEGMRAKVHDEFLSRARAHITEQGIASMKVDKRYWIVPWPRGFFGWIWTILTLLNLAFLVMMIVAAAVGISNEVQEKPDSLMENLGIFLIVVFILALPTLLFRWFSFMSARMAQRSRARRAEREAARQTQAA